MQEKSLQRKLMEICNRGKVFQTFPGSIKRCTILVSLYTYRTVFSTCALDQPAVLFKGQ